VAGCANRCRLIRSRRLCPCGGLMFDVTIGLAHQMGVKQYECDMCHDRRAISVREEP